MSSKISIKIAAPFIAISEQEFICMCMACGCAIEKYDTDGKVCEVSAEDPFAFYNLGARVGVALKAWDERNNFRVNDLSPDSVVDMMQQMVNYQDMIKRRRKENNEPNPPDHGGI